MTTETVLTLPLADVAPDPAQPRKIFSDAEIKSLAASLRSKGLLQPISVRKNPAGSPPWLILAGERRWRAHLHNKAETIRAIEVKIEGVAKVLAAQIIENCQRVDMTALEEAEAYQRLVEELGGDVDKAAAELGKMPWRILERTCLLKLEPEYKKLLAAGQLQNSQGFELAQLSPLGQHRLFRAIAGGQCPTYNALRACALALREQEAQASMFDTAAAPPPPSEAEREAATRLEKKIAQVCRLLAAGFDENECVAAKRVDPNKAATYAEKIALIRRHLEQMEKALRASAVTSDLFSKCA